MLLLAGDIGGTKTNLAIYSVERGPRNPVAEKKYPSDDYATLEAMVREFLREFAVSVDDIDHARFGIAGPVVQGRAKVTNLPWVVDEDALETGLELKSVRLLNDLEAIANGVPFLEADDLHTLNAGEAVEGGALAVIAPGTGLGEGYLIRDGDRYVARASEGGHVDFAPRNELEVELLSYLWRRFKRVSYERVCSGIGIPNIYDFLRDSGYAEEPEWLREKLRQAEDRTPVIITTAQDENLPCELCDKTFGLFVSILGAEAGNLALKLLSTGGVYLAGGIPPRIIPALEGGSFMQAFTDKGRMADVLARMPVHVVLNPKVALLGAACHGLAAV